MKHNTVNMSVAAFMAPALQSKNTPVFYCERQSKGRETLRIDSVKATLNHFKLPNVSEACVPLKCDI